jgi:hypothetical protein
MKKTKKQVRKFERSSVQRVSWLNRRVQLGILFPVGKPLYICTVVGSGIGRIWWILYACIAHTDVGARPAGKTST